MRFTHWKVPVRVCSALVVVVGATACLDGEPLEPETTAVTKPEEAEPEDCPDYARDVDDGGSEQETGLGETWCWTVAPSLGGELVLIEVDMDAGTWAEVATYSSPDTDSGFYTGGMGRLGDTLVMGAGGRGFSWYELDMSAGTVTRGADSGYFVSVTSDGAYLIAESNQDLCWYLDFASLNAGEASCCIPAPNGSSRFGSNGSEIFGAWHSTSSLTVYDAASGRDVRSLALEDWDTWVWGVSVAGGMVHLIDDGRGSYAGSGRRIARFDGVSGLLIDDVFLSELPTDAAFYASGLWCEER